MIGREREAREVGALIAAGHRLITVIGPPGAGKSRLARAVSGDLMLLDDPDPAAVSTLLASDRRVLATARAPLQLAGEVRFHLGPLAEREAMELFDARASESGHPISKDDEADLRTIVRRLDALPLFIEWAAEKIAILSVAELRERLDRSLGMFARMEEVIDRSWAALGEEEREVLCRLSIFPGSFSLDACERVLGGGDRLLRSLHALQEASLLHRVDAPELDPKHRARLALYRPVREVARSRLKDADELARRHAQHHLDELESKCTREICLRDPRAVELLAAEEENLLGIHARFVASEPVWAARAGLLLDALHSIRGPFDRHLEILSSSIDACAEVEGGLLGSLLRARGEALRTRRRLEEARVDLERALAHAEKARDLEQTTLCLQELGILAREEGAPDAHSFLERALEGARSLGQRPLEGILLGNLGTLHRYLGEVSLARDFYRHALAIHREVANRRSEMIAIGNLGHLDVLEERTDRARDSYRSALVILEEMSDVRSEAIILAHLGGIEAWRGDLPAAEWLFHRASHLAAQIGDRPMRSLCLAELGAIDAARARIEASRRCFVEARRILVGLDAIGWRATIYVLEGLLELALGHREEAQRRLDDVQEDRSTAHTEFLRLAVVRLSEALRGSEVVAPSAMTLEASRDGRWFRFGTEEKVSLERRKPLKRIFAHLILERAAHPNEVVSLASIVRAGWPGEKLIPHSATTRAYVAISTLRRLGLKDALVSRDGGYLLLPSVSIIFSGP